MELYKTVKHEFLTDIENFSLKHRLSLFHKIKKENNRRNLESFLTEAHFGLFLDTIGTNIKYNSLLGKTMTPDFSFVRSEQEIIVEVARINPVQKDMDIEEEEERAIEAFQLTNPGKRFMTKPQSITWKPDKVVGQKGTIAIKASKYKDAITKLNKPFIICVYMAFVSGLDRLDLMNGLYGSSTVLSGKYNAGSYVVGAPFHILENALYYNNIDVKQTVSGILLKDHDGSFAFFANFSASNRLNPKNWKFFQSMQSTIS